VIDQSTWRTLKIQKKRVSTNPNYFTMKILNRMIVASVILASSVSCSHEEVIPSAASEGLPNAITSESNSARLNYWSVYVMDVRFSRETCATGPGVCFKDGFGDIWDYSLIDNSNDPDVGPIGVELAGDQLHLTFYRSLEEDTFIVQEDVAINETLCRALGKSSLSMKTGRYAVSYKTHKFGEALVDIISGR
jgi:hypothetical protein